MGVKKPTLDCKQRVMPPKGVFLRHQVVLSLSQITIPVIVLVGDAKSIFLDTQLQSAPMGQ